MADFKKQGGVLTGREERYDGFEGEPRTVGGSHTSTTGISTGSGLTGSHSTHGTHGTHGHGLTGSNTTGSGLTGSNTTGRESLGERVREGERDLKTGHSHSTTGTTGAGYGSTTGRNSEVDSKTGKPSLMDKLNPMKDTDHDGKKGMMD